MGDRALHAHSVNGAGVRHELAAHLRGSAALARRFGEVFGAGEAAAYLALVHDVGKGTCVWQEGLVRAEACNERVGVPHKSAGALLASRFVGRSFAALVDGHHGGLPDRNRVRDVLRALTTGGPEAVTAGEATAAVQQLVPEIVPATKVALPAWACRPGGGDGALMLEMLSRMLFSTLVDADFLDTAAHFADRAPSVRADADMEALRKRFEVRREGFVAGRSGGSVDGVREEIYQQVVAAGAGAPGMHVLHVPTGGGKTLASAGFALRHAAEHGLRRVVVAVPFISVTEQNAQVYREMLDPLEGEVGERVVLEHHSSADLDGGGAARWARLAAENWDAPVVVTTTVQLFQSLFDRLPSAMRKLHRLAGSVIVLDEVQALPDRLLAPILSALRSLVDHFGATVVFASATQPEFWSLRELAGTSRLEMVQDVEELFERLRRVEYVWRLEEGLTWDVLAGDILQEPERQVLAVVNTTVDAARLHRAVSEAVADDPGVGSAGGVEGGLLLVLHLSTRMTAGHRREVIAQVKKRLLEGLPTVVVSTSLIEAGVDLDFPCVYRAMAPAESLQQAAGRSNREGRRDRGRVVIVRPADGGAPQDKAYVAACDATGMFFGPDLSDPDDLAALTRYYQDRYSAQGSDGHAFGEPIQALRRNLDFPKVAEAFQMIETDHTTPVVYLRDSVDDADRERTRQDIDRLRRGLPCGPGALRRLQPHTASLPRHEAAAAVDAGLASPITGDLVEWLGHYDEHRGLDRDQPEDRHQYLV
ncbi:CRISPR-associated endonuclease Cas3'' [Streptomyces spiramenti]|uniref:CRISPR-associated endonuclease Cas3 n=1 Tax=Streptomyces spiramenti TaxID=2720606 RepID=A0ABX1AJZ0_9ACTN|nr:CRISPR-associated endonuclease Cas3'' [Streptomyces spiramenti]NJP64802.1 CRISPR-associated endonuclease Cas3'' [Streptomyces spiramenti]